MTGARETDLYAPVKAWLEALGYEVKAEIGPVDVMALDDEGEPVVIELKRGFSLALLKQAVSRQSVTGRVYVAVPRWRGRAGWRAFRGNLALCRRLGVGVLSVREADGFVEEHCAPQIVASRRSAKRRTRLMTEFAARRGDPNAGGLRGPVETAYKQDARICVAYLAANGPSSGADIAKKTGVARATRIMADNHSGWFYRLKRGIYVLSDAGSAEVSCSKTTSADRAPDDTSAKN